jgi:acyl carrier protein
MKSVAERVLPLIARQKSIPVEQLAPEQSLADLQFDSLDKVTLVFDIEEEFHIRITDAELATLRTVGEIIDGIQSKIAAQEQA